MTRPETVLSFLWLITSRPTLLAAKSSLAVQLPGASLCWLAGWGAAASANCLRKPIRSSNVLGFNLGFLTTPPPEEENTIKVKQLLNKILLEILSMFPK